MTRVEGVPLTLWPEEEKCFAAGKVDAVYAIISSAFLHVVIQDTIKCR